jgi:hypothetical protein
MGRFDDAESFWDAMLSEDAAQVRAAWAVLDAGERRDVEAHLTEMADVAEGYAEVQQASARFALATIREGRPAS